MKTPGNDLIDLWTQAISRPAPALPVSVPVLALVSPFYEYEYEGGSQHIPNIHRKVLGSYDSRVITPVQEIASSMSGERIPSKGLQGTLPGGFWGG